MSSKELDEAIDAKKEEVQMKKEKLKSDHWLETAAGRY